MYAHWRHYLSLISNGTPRDFDGSLCYLGELSDGSRLAEKESFAAPPRITPGNSTDFEKASTSHESLRTDLHETLPTAQQEKVHPLLALERQPALASTVGDLRLAPNPRSQVPT